MQADEEVTTRSDRTLVYTPADDVAIQDFDRALHPEQPRVSVSSATASPTRVSDKDGAGHSYGEADSQNHHKSHLGPLGIAVHHPTEFFRRKSSGARRSSAPRRSSIIAFKRVGTGRHWWKFHLRDWNDEDEQDWWFASTAIPLLAATIGPLANVLSIAALVTYWRMCVTVDATPANASTCAWNGTTADLVLDTSGVTFRDPRWCYWLNAVSLIAGFVGNVFLLFNFTNRIRYIIALPVTIFMWYVAAGILIGITIAMALYVPPVQPQQTYSQGYWYAVMAACLYMVCAMLLMVNMLGYFLGHYPQHFTLTDSQRTLILQTMLFFIWLAGGAAVFSDVEQTYGAGEYDWSYVNSLYFCDVTILTVGFGDLYATSNAGRGLVFPYSIGGIIMLGLMVSSISKFAGELGTEKVIRRHIEHSRARTVGRTVTTSLELEHRRALTEGDRPIISAPFDPVELHSPREPTINFAESDGRGERRDRDDRTDRFTLSRSNTLKRVSSWAKQPVVRRPTRKPKLILLREERDRFNAMRKIQVNTSQFKAWSALCASVAVFGLVWAGGAAIFYLAERDTQGMTYFQGLYFCYVSLLTIGYGDLAPKSNVGRPFFVVWSLIAVPTMTILIATLGDTVINRFKKGIARLGDFTVLPQKGVWREFLNNHPWLLMWVQQRVEHRNARKRLEEGFRVGPEPEAPVIPPTIDELAAEEPSEADLAKQLAKALQRVARDAKADERRTYTYEEWVEFTRLIRFTALDPAQREADEDEEGLIDWDWIGEDSPMMAQGSEADFVLERLCESMMRYVRNATRSSSEPQANDDAEPGQKDLTKDRKDAGSTSGSATEGDVVENDLDDADGPEIGPMNEKSR